MVYNKSGILTLIIYEKSVEALYVQNDRLFSQFTALDQLDELFNIIKKSRAKGIHCFDSSDHQDITIEHYPLKIGRKDLLSWILNKRKAFLKNKKNYKGCHLLKNKQLLFVELSQKSPIYKVEAFLRSKGIYFLKVFSYALEKGRMFNTISRPLLSSSKSFSLIVAYNQDRSMQHWVFKGEHLLFTRSWKVGSITLENQEDLVPHSMYGTKKFLEKKEDKPQISIVFFCEEDNQKLVHKICEVFPISIFFLPKDIVSMTSPIQWNSPEERRLFAPDGQSERETR